MQYQQIEIDAILAWYKSILNVDHLNLLQFYTGEFFQRTASKIHNFTFTAFTITKQDSWTVALSHFKRFYKQLQRYYRGVLDSSFDSNFCNILQLAQQKDQTQLFRMAVQVFGAALLSANKLDFIQVIQSLSSEVQQVIGSIILSHKFHEMQYHESQHNQAEPEPIRRQSDVVEDSQINVLLTKVEMLEADNTQLENKLQTVEKAKRQLQLKCKQYMIENQRLREQLEQKQSDIENNHKYEAETSIYEQENKDMIKQLKERLYEQQSKHLMQQSELREQIEILMTNLERYKKDAQLNFEADKESTVSSQSKMRPIVQHPPCVSLVNHQQLMLKQSQKIKQLTKQEWEKNLEIMKLQSKIKQMTKQLNKLKEQVNKKTETIDKKDSEKIKTDILTMLLYKLKDEAAVLKARN